MNATIQLRTILFGIITILLISACASTPKIDPRVTALQDNLARITSNQDLASRGGKELTRAERAVSRVASAPKSMKPVTKDYYLYSADRLVQVAEFTARTRLAEDHRKDLMKEQDSLILQSRTLEADNARKMAAEARLSAAEAIAMRTRALKEAAEAEKMRDFAQAASNDALEKQRLAEIAAQSALSDAEQARAEADAAKAEMNSLRNRLSELEAKQTERGLLITLGDVLFEFNQSELKAGSTRNLRPLADALNERTEQLIIIEGHTDSVGSHAYNVSLSEKRANAVKLYLLDNGISADRISTKGLGPDFPVSNNDTASGRQRNRRVEVILPN